MEAFDNVSKNKEIKISGKCVNNILTIVFEDNGKGISEENLSEVFYTFFTTKPLGKGTGLGLSIVKSVIEKHNGSIRIDSIFGEWTKVIIQLPIID